MPSHTAASGLVQIYFATTPPGLMWTWPVWQEITGINHGLFPSNDAHLPAGMSRQDATEIKAYFDMYNSIKSKTKKFAFATGSKGAQFHPGQPKWNHFVTMHWSRWNVHNITLKAFREHGVHPATLLMNEGNLENSKAWLDSDGYIPVMVDSLGRSLFGDDAFHAGSEFLPGKVREGLQSIAQRVWNTTRVQLSRLRQNRDKIQAAAEAAMENKPLTKTNLTSMIRAVAKWRDTSELFSTPENTYAATEMLAQLQTVMTGLGVNVSRRIEPKGTSKVSPLALKALASAEDVSDIAALYHDYFELSLPDDDETNLPDIPEDQKSLNDCGGDFGMEVECSTPPAQLAISLGFTSGIPPVFMRYRHHTGANFWDDRSLLNNVDEDVANGKLLKFSLHWHQLAGVHSIARTVFTRDSRPSDTVGVLIADEVGLGKTAQSIAFISFLNLVISAQKRKRALPKVIRDTPFLGAQSIVPSLPHLIICPGTLMPQWGSEIKSLLVFHAVDIFFYDGSVPSDQFWGPTGAFQSSEHKLHNRIVIASHSIITKDFMATHSTIPKRKKQKVMPWEIPNPRKDLSNTIFGQNFLVVIVDEAHNYRNAGNKHISVLRVLKNAAIRLPMTATPLHTSSKDIASMLRLTGVPHFFTDASMVEEKEDAAALRRAKKMDDDGLAAHEEQVRAVKRLQTQARGHFLRRTTDSVNFEGKPLVPLPPLVEISGVLKITSQEKAIMDRCNEQAKAMIDVCESASPSEIKTKNFYNDYRVTIVWAKENPGDPYPTFKSLAEWQAVKTTKLDVAARICNHYTSRDDVPHVSFHDGHPVFPPPSVGNQSFTRTRRILMFAYFSSMVSLFQNVLSLYNVPSLAINGKITVAKRDKIVKAFYDDSQPARVLILSSVGNAGLNLSCADVIIFFDQPWSSQEERQIRGRAWRQPQKKTVTEIHLFAEDSADLVMYQVARGKKNAFDSFVNKETGKELRQILTGSVLDNGDYIKDKPDATHEQSTKDASIVDLPDPIDLPEATSDFSMFSSDAISERYSERMYGFKTEEVVSDKEKTEAQQPAVAVGKISQQIVDEDEQPSASDQAVSEVAPVASTLLLAIRTIHWLNLSTVAAPTAQGGDNQKNPAKRPRQGTIGDKGRAQIIAESSQIIPQTSETGRFSFIAQQARPLMQQLSSVAPSVLDTTRALSPGPRVAEHTQRLARLDDLAPPPRAALMGAPVREKKRKGKDPRRSRVEESRI
ncbi:hypothetical protein C0993_012196 [Termitomyces sp. T159_Od127]|nr:hypothetical protein C0993_012196 [Termitomyces sp. T159_Od127]